MHNEYSSTKTEGQATAQFTHKSTVSLTQVW